jgi:hypothetical protein
MASLLQAIGEILRPDLLQKGAIRLEESDPGSTCEPITINKRGPAVVLKPDIRPEGVCGRPGCQFTFTAPDRLFPLFRLDVAGLTAVCDYIVFCQENPENDARVFVLLCELKSNNLGGARRQIENGRLLADYVLHMAALQTKRPLPAVERRGLIFSPKFSMPKGSLRATTCAYQPEPSGFPDLPFARYAHGAEYPLAHFCV